QTNYGRRPKNPGRSTAHFSARFKLGSCCVWTMHKRAQHYSASALLIASHFSAHPKIERVLYPGLADHPGHEIAKRQMRGGYGGMMSIQVAGGRDAELRVTKVVRLFIPATSLRSVESLLEHRATVEGPDSSVPDNLLRISVGIQDVGDLVADLEQALTQA
ncbi:MAG: PLP-dependent transferase, partial [Pseudomonadota bacterium]|nr:PLP-dependent transferase [Pseudomonadota bacterium]